MSKKIGKAWLFGSGYWANILVSKIQNQFNPSNVFVIDPDENSLLTFISKNSNCYPSNFERFQDEAQIGDKCFVATPPSTHFDIVDKALDLGCHVWVEKPLTVKGQLAHLLIAKAQEKKLTLFIDNTFLFDPLIEKIKLRLQLNGLPYFMHSQRLGWGKILKDYGVLWDLLPHDLSIINYIFGNIFSYELVSVTFGPKNTGLDKTAISAAVNFMTKNDIKIRVDLSVVNKSKIRQFQIFTNNEILSYQMSSNGSIVSQEKWGDIPGNMSIAHVNENFNEISVEDNLENALKAFAKLSESKELHTSIFTAAKEIEIIEDLYTQSLILGDFKLGI